MIPTGILQTRSAVDQPALACPYIQMIARISSGTGPICAMHSTNVMAVSRPGCGTPHTHSPRPTSAVCINAVTTTPSATPCTDFPARITACCAVLVADPPRECDDALCRGLARCVQDSRKDHGQQEVQEHAAHAAGDRDHVAGHRARVGPHRFGERPDRRH